MGDLKARLANRVQLTTDGHKAYLLAFSGGKLGGAGVTADSPALRPVRGLTGGVLDFSRISYRCGQGARYAG